MGHRSVPPPDDDVDPFWHAAESRRPPGLARFAHLLEPARSWVVAAIALAAVAGIGWWLVRPAAPPVESTLPSAEVAAADGTPGAPAAGGPAPSVTTSTSAPDVVVQAAGAVAEPGVYSLPAGARVDDLVDAAGGLTSEADTDRVNLAAPVADGERIWVPQRGEREPPEVVAGTGSGGSPAGGGAAGGTGSTPVPDQPIDLNQATAEQLDALPGVGPATATAILAYRDQRGRFGSVDELLEVRGIGEAKLEQIRPLVRV